MQTLYVVGSLLWTSFHYTLCEDLSAEKHAEEESKDDSLITLLVVGLLILTVLTIWLFKVKRFRFIHESGLCIFYGMIAGAVIRYTV